MKIQKIRILEQTSILITLPTQMTLTYILSTSPRDALDATEERCVSVEIFRLVAPDASRCGHEDSSRRRGRSEEIYSQVKIRNTRNLMHTKTDKPAVTHFEFKYLQIIHLL